MRAVQQHDGGRPASVVLQGDEHQPRHAQALAGPAAPAGAAGRGQDAGAGEDDRAHGPRRGRAGSPDPRLVDGLEKTLMPWV